MGLSEKWLQDEIEKDPSLLGLGVLEIVSREHRQPAGGRIDFLMRNIEDDSLFEVEIMLGSLDASHIIRTIEYWDIERQRRPNKEHRAVIVAEDITSRFFNVLRLLNRAVPLIAIKMTAFEVDSKVYIQFVKVLDVIEEILDDDVDPVERSDRNLWEKKSPWLLAVLDFITSNMTERKIDCRVAFNRSHIAIGSSGNNFCWLNVRTNQRCNIELRIGGEVRDDELDRLQKQSIDVFPKGEQYISFTASIQELEMNKTAFSEVLAKAEYENR